MEEWTIAETSDFRAKIKSLAGTNGISVESALANLVTYMDQLFHGINPMQIKFGFIHPEGNHGAIAIAGSRRTGVRAVRVYVYPDVETKTLHLVTAGDKDSQKRTDIPIVRGYVKKQRANQRSKDE